MSANIAHQLNDALKNHRYDAALEYCDQLLISDHNIPEVQSVKGWCFYKLNDTDKAEHWLFKAFYQDPSNVNAADLSTRYLFESAKYHECLSFCQECIAFHKTNNEIWVRLAASHFHLGNIEASVIAYRRALQIKQDTTTAFRLSQPLLCQGNYKEGFQLYEHRFDVQPDVDWLKSKNLSVPQWHSEDIAGKSILVWTEQGLGDTIQFSQIVIKLAEQGATVDVALQSSHASLTELLSSLHGVANVIEVSATETTTFKRIYDFHCPMMSLMKSIKLEPDTNLNIYFPYLSLVNKDDYIDTKDNLLNQLSKVPEKNLKVGIVWQTELNPAFKEQHYIHFAIKDRKSMNAQDVLPILAMDGISFFSLHVNKSQSVQELINEKGIIDMEPYISDFSDTAMIIESMDLVVSIDTSVVHLAGALNKPTINLLMYAADWRWQIHREDTPWYPSMRLLRQSSFGHWESVSQRLKKILSSVVQEYQASGKVDIWQS